MKKELKNIKSLIDQNPKYQNIEKKLDYSDFNNSTVPQTKQNNWLKVFIPVTAIGLAMIIAVSIVVPNLSIRKQSKINVSDTPTSEQVILNKEAHMEPVSEDVMSFYMNNAYSKGSYVPRPITTISDIYKLYKNDPEEFNEMKKNIGVYNLVKENKLHCYYVNKELHEAVNEQLKHGRRTSDIFLPWRGLTAYVEGFHYYNLSASVEDPQIMEMSVDIDIDSVDLVLNDYYLLDIVRYYNESSFEDFFYIDFVSYSEISGKAVIGASDTKDSIKYCSWTYNPISSYLQTKKYYGFFWTIDYLSFEITLENGIEVAKERFVFNQSDPSFYDDIEECIISKSNLVEGSNSKSYDVTFDFNKLVKLFGF